MKAIPFSMMLQFPSFSILFLTSLLFFLMVVKHFWKRSSIPKLPPGPPKLPLIGNLHQLSGSSQLPHRFLRDLAQKYGPIMSLKLGEVSAIIISSPEAAEEVLKTHDVNFAQRPNAFAVDIMGYGYSSFVYSPYGNYWRQLRKICTSELLSEIRVRAFRSMREEEVSKFVESISSSLGGPINLTHKIFHLMNCITSRAAFGERSIKDATDLMAVVREGGELGGGFDMADLFPSFRFLPFISRTKSALEKLHQRLDKVLENVINEHKAKRAMNGATSGVEDIVDVLLRVQESNDPQFPITTSNIKSIILEIFAGGTDTSATTIEWAMSEMLKNPNVMKKAQAEVRQVLKGKRKINEADIQELIYLKLVLNETLRLHPPIPLSPRESRGKCEINGYEIPIKAKVIINQWALARDPKHWDDPDCFQPERFDGSSISYKGTNFEYIPFGAGRRICPGISFGMAADELAVAQLLYYFDWKLPNGITPENFDMTEAFGIAIKRKRDLYVTATPVSSFV